MCLLVSRAPASCLALSSMEVLGKAEALFKEAARECQAAARSLVSVVIGGEKLRFTFGL
jgi:hypothetical protein